MDMNFETSVWLIRRNVTWMNEYHEALFTFTDYLPKCWHDRQSAENNMPGMAYMGDHVIEYTPVEFPFA